jgi:hypothetical protein
VPAGPVNIHENVLRAMNVPGQNHRDPWFAAFFKDVLADSKYVFQTQKGTPFIFTGAGSCYSMTHLLQLTWLFWLCCYMSEEEQAAMPGVRTTAAAQPAAAVNKLCSQEGMTCCLQHVCSCNRNSSIGREGTLGRRIASAVVLPALVVGMQ